MVASETSQTLEQMVARGGVGMEQTFYGRGPVRVYGGMRGQTFNVRPLLRNPDNFHGDPNVHNLVCFGPLFEELVGSFEDPDGRWEDKNALVERGIVVLEHHVEEAAVLMQQINALAGRVVEDKQLYDDPQVCGEFYSMTREGYQLLNKYEPQFGLSQMEGTTPVSLERAGLVTTRLALEVPYDAVIENELRVVTKRTHLLAEPESFLSASVKWRCSQEEILWRLSQGRIVVVDFVNPASGASVVAFVLAGQTIGVDLREIHHRSISLTRQGVEFNRRAMAVMGVKTSFYSLGDCSEMNEAYYLIDKPVGDAGDMLQGMLPPDYKQ